MRAVLIFFFMLFMLHLAAQDTLVRLQEIEVLEFAVEPSAAFKVKELSGEDLPAPQTLADKIQSATAIFVKGYGANGVASVGIRGTGAFHTLLNWNGINIASPTLGQADFSLFPASVADEISIRYGLSSLIDGSGGLGGSIVLQNNLDFSSQFGLNAVASAGSFGQHNYSVQVKTGTNRFQNSTTFYYNKAENNFPYHNITKQDWPVERLQHAKNEGYGIVQLLGWKPDAYNVISGKLWLNKLWRELPASIFTNSTGVETMNDINSTGSFSWTRKKNTSEMLVQSGFSQMENTFAEPDAGLSSATSGFSWQNEIRLQKSLADEKIKLQAGVEHTTDWVESSGFTDAITQNTVGVYTSADVHVSREIAASALLRLEESDMELSPLLGSLAAIWRSGKSAVKLSAARNYRPPSLNELYWQPGGNPKLLPEKSWNVEVGYSFVEHFRKSSLKAEITGYRNEIDNWVIWLPLGAHWSPQNIKKVLNTGAELELELNIILEPVKVRVMASYSFTSSINKQFYNGESNALNKQLIYVPAHKLNNSVHISYKNFTADYQFHLHGKYYISSDNKVYMPAFTVSDVRLGYRLPMPSGGNFTFAASVNNIFDYHYQIIPYRPEMGINYLFSVCYAFTK